MKTSRRLRTLQKFHPIVWPKRQLSRRLHALLAPRLPELLPWAAGGLHLLNGLAHAGAYWLAYAWTGADSPTAVLLGWAWSAFWVVLFASLACGEFNSRKARN